MKIEITKHNMVDWNNIKGNYETEINLPFEYIKLDNEYSIPTNFEFCCQKMVGLFMESKVRVGTDQIFFNNVPLTQCPYCKSNFTFEIKEKGIVVEKPETEKDYEKLDEAMEKLQNRKIIEEVK